MDEGMKCIYDKWYNDQRHDLIPDGVGLSHLSSLPLAVSELPDPELTPLKIYHFNYYPENIWRHVCCLSSFMTQLFPQNWLIISRMALRLDKYKQDFYPVILSGVHSPLWAWCTTDHHDIPWSLIGQLPWTLSSYWLISAILVLAMKILMGTYLAPLGLA